MGVPGAAAALGQQAQVLDPDVALDPLDHVVQGQGGGGGGGQGLHLDPGAAGGPHGGGDPDGVGLKGQVDLDPGDRQRVAQRDQVGGALGPHDAGHPGHGQGVALGQAGRGEQLKGLGGEHDPQPAVATRSVSGLAETSTIRAAPWSSRWLSSPTPGPP